MDDRRISFQRPGEHHPDQLLLGDNLQVMEAMDDGAVDCIYMDPPFGTGKTRRGGGHRPRSRYHDERADPQRFMTWLKPRLEHSRRVLADHGSLFVHLDYRSAHYVKVALDDIFGRKHFINEIIWCYSVGGKSRRRFARKHDTILWYARTDDYAFFDRAIRVPRRGNSHMRMVHTAAGELVQEKTDRKTGKVYRYPVSAGKIPEDWWTDIELLNRSDGERVGWPTQKPERLLERILKATSAPGSLVVDWFSGSGTTAVVAQRLDRRFLAIDREPEAVDLALARLQAAGQALADTGSPPRDIVCRALPARNIG